MNLEINALNALQTLAYYTLKGAYGITDPPEGVEIEAWQGTYPPEVLEQAENIIHGFNWLINSIEIYNSETYGR